MLTGEIDLGEAKRTISSLTGLRFAAALIVFFSHYPIPGLSGWCLRVDASGYAGVTFFFVLSGFIISYNYLDSFLESPTTHLGKYAISRFARIYPLYILATVYVWFNTGSNVSLWPYVFMTQAWSSDLNVAMGLDGPAWSLSVEAFLYFSFPFLVPAMKAAGIFSSRKNLLVAAVVTVAAMLTLAIYFTVSGRGALGTLDPNSAHRWLYRTPVTRIFDFILGMLAAVFYLQFSPATSRGKTIWKNVTYAACAVVVALMASKKNFYSAFSWDISYAIPGVLIILGLAMGGSSLISIILSSSIFVALGEASYAFYLIHVPAGVMRSTIPQSFVNSFVLYLIFLILVISLAYGLHKIIENPVRVYVRKLLSFRHFSGSPRPATKRSWYRSSSSVEP
jgi:peptidoglycan/LPS O-acetylase OafA/YrhL